MTSGRVAPSITANRSAVRTTVAIAVAVVVLVVAQLLLQDGAPSWRTIWAEDGSIFYEDARRDGLAAVFTPYAGYGLLVPRLVAVPATWLPLRDLAAYLALAGAMVTAFACVSVFVLTRRLIESRILRVALAASPAALPVMAFENLANITNVIWPLTFACFWALVREPRDRREAWFGATVAFVGMASAGLAVLFAPIALYAAVTRRTKEQRIVLGAYGLAGLYQAVMYLTATDRGPSGTANGLVRLFEARVLGGTVLGEHWAGSLFERHGYWPLDLAAIALVGFVALLLVQSRGEHRRLGALMLATSVVVFVIPLMLRGTLGLDLEEGTWSSAGARYAGLASLILMSAIFVLMGETRLGATFSQISAIVMCVGLIAIVAFAVPVRNLRSEGPEWHPALVERARRCRQTSAGRTELPITPAGGWFVKVPCADVIAAVRE